MRQGSSDRIKFTERDDETRQFHHRGTIYPGQASVYLMTGLVNAICRHEVKWQQRGRSWMAPSATFGSPFHTSYSVPNRFNATGAFDIMYPS